MLRNLGWYYPRLGDFDRALHSFVEAAARAREVEDDVLQRWLNNIGNVHYRRGDFREAISYYQQAADLAKHLNDASWLTMILDNLAATSVAYGDLAAAERFNVHAEALIRKTNNSDSLLHS